MAIGAEGVAERPFQGLLVRPFQARGRIVPSAKERGA